MNDQAPAASERTELPELAEASIERIEQAVFAEIAAERSPAPIAPPAADPRAGRRRTRRRWLTGIGVAAAFVAGALITPPLLQVATTTAGGAGTYSVPENASAGASDVAEAENSVTDTTTSVDPSAVGREVIANAAATVRVDDVATAMDAIAALAADHSGYVENTDITAAGSTGETVPQGDPANGYGWITVRVPADDLGTVIEELGDTGTVLSSSTSQQDVTSVAIDLRARVDATQASVDRLTELMAQSGSVSELIDAEVALTDRQAQLESYTQQLAVLEDQVAMSSLQVQVTQATTVSPAEPAGFGDGLLAGWNGLIATLNGLVIALGFLLPWLVIAAAAGLIVWVIVRRRRRRPTPAASENP